MQHSSCRRDDIVMAFDDLVRRFEERRVALWAAYLEATNEMTRREYELHEADCWSVLRAGLAGIDAEHRVLQRDFERRLRALDDTGVAA